jgi:hypothetical protein
VCFAGGCTSGGPRATADAFSAVFRVSPDGSVLVREEMRVRVDPAATSFDRRVVFDRADGVMFSSASLDGRVIGRDDPSLEVRDGKALNVRWQFAAGSPSHTLVLEYRAVNVVEIHGRRGHVRLRVLDPSRRFDVVEARLALQPPQGVQLDELSGVSEAGWTVARVDGGVAAERRGLAANETATIAGELPIDPSRMTDPTWQINEERADQFAAAFISGGLFILVVGAGILWIVRFEHPSRRKDDEAERRVVRRGLRLGGLACIVLSGLTALVTWIALAPFGIAAMAVPVSILIVGLVFVVLGGVIV